MAFEPAPLPSLSLVGGFSLSAISYSMTAEAGSYTLSGQAIDGLKGRRITADSGAYSLAGETGYIDILMTAARGTYTLTAFDVGLSKSQRSVAAERGTYSLTGQGAGLFYIERVLTLLPEAGSYTLNTFAVNLIATAVLTGNKVKQRTQVWARDAIVTSNVTVSTEAVIGTDTPDVFFLKGTSATADISDYATGTGNVIYTVATGALGSGVTLGTDGILTYDGSGGPGVHRIAVSADNVVTGSRFEFANIPELVFVEGIAETEELGPYQLDPNNPWTPGDLTNASGWQAAQTCQLLSGGLPVADAWLSYNAVTGRLTYSGAAISGASRDYTCILRNGSRDSDTFRIRILRPTHVYGFGSLPGDAVAANGWTGAVAIDAAVVPFAGPNSNNGPVRQGSKGQTDAAPRVVFFTGEDFLSTRFASSGDNGWIIKGGQQASPNDTSYLYLLGDPNRRPRLYQNSGFQQMSMRYSSILWYVKNFDLERCRLSMTTLTSDRKANWYIHKVSQTGSNTGAAGGDAIGSSFTYTPFAFPSESRVDATDGSLGTYFHTYVTFFEGIGNGNTGNTVHQMYMEGNGTASAYINASLFAGAQACSTVKSIQSELRVRNSLLSVAPDYDTFTSADPWAVQLMDVKATCDWSAYNCEFRVGVSGSKGVRVGIFNRKRRTAMGAEVPPYPEDNWNPPLGDAGHKDVPNFSDGAETFANDAYWAAVTSIDRLSPDNPYTFKHYVANCTWRRMIGSQGNTFRDDGTHPTEATAQFAHSTILGTHPDWVERSVTFFANNRHIGYNQANVYELDDTDAIDVIENGTGNAAQSYFVTWNDGTQGYIRVNNFSGAAKSWTASLNSQISALGGSSLNGVPWTTVQANLISQVAQPLYPPAKFGPDRDQPKAVAVGGISFDNAPASPIELPDWFKI